MKLMIGEKIRKLRREKNRTQEEVAAHLNISFQSVSKWERGEGYPDITLLPALARYFSVTVDELMGMNELAAQEEYDRINAEWRENHRAGRHEENVALMKRALSDWPNDELFLVQLSTSLEKPYGSEEERRMRLMESIAVQEQILRCGKDSEVRGATMYNICFAYDKIGDREKAIAQAKKLPNLYKARENALVHFVGGRERAEVSRAALEPLSWAIGLHLRVLAEEEGRDEWREKAERICSLLKEGTGDSTEKIAASNNG